jgi:hypothetical protein
MNKHGRPPEYQMNEDYKKYKRKTIHEKFSQSITAEH